MQTALALPLGELSPQVTERVLQPSLNGLVRLALSGLALLGHLSRRERQVLHSTKKNPDLSIEACVGITDLPG